MTADNIRVCSVTINAFVDQGTGVTTAEQRQWLSQSVADLQAIVREITADIDRPVLCSNVGDDKFVQITLCPNGLDKQSPDTNAEWRAFIAPTVRKIRDRFESRVASHFGKKSAYLSIR